MSVSPNWQPIVFILGMCVVAIGVLIFAGPWMLAKLRGKAVPGRIVDTKQKRKADAQASDETVEYNTDIIDSLIDAPPDFVLRVLKIGVSRDCAKGMWIQELVKDRKPTAKAKGGAV